MDLTEIAPGLHLVRVGIANAYLWRDPAGRDEGAVLVDTGPPGSAPAITAALEQLGLRRQDVRLVVLTHFHDDHAGSAAEAAAWGAEIVAGAGDAPFVAGERPGPAPVFTPAEQALHAVVAVDLLPAPPAPVHRRVVEGDALDFAGGAQVLAVPGHTPGSIALHLPAHGVLLSGDTIAEHEGHAVLGPFNTDRAGAWTSLQRLAALPVDVAGFGHGNPLTADAATALRAATDPFA